MDINNKPFIEYIASFGKPIILSTGASNVNEIKDAVKWINNFNCELCLLHCVLNYIIMNVICYYRVLLC